MSPVFWARLWRACTCLLVACCVVLAERRDEAVGDSDASEPNSHPAHHYLNQWAVEVQGGEEGARRVARETGFTYLSKVGTLDDFHTFAHPHHPEVHHEHAHEKTSVLHGHAEVRWAEQQKVLKRSKRSTASQEHAPRHLHHRHHQQHPGRRRQGLPKRDVPLSANATLHGQPYHDPRDPMWSQMWYHFRRYQEPMPVWRRGYTGRGVVISILDDGIEYTHPDLKNQYDPEASYDYNGNDPDPMPRPSYENKHGTRCAGEASAGLNDVCVVGAAYNSSIGGVRMLDGTVTDIVEGHSLSFHPQHIDIYSSSWGPDDDGLTVDGPARLAQAAFKQGTEKGRGGLGSIFVWASGNGGSKGDSCGCDGYTNTIYSISVSAMSEHGASPWYSEHCSSTLASTYSSGKKSQGERQIVTVDLNDGCTSAHTGTSAAAPMAAGLLALVLEANPKLTWRDVQHIVVLTSQPHPPDAVNYQPNIWTRNAAGHTHSHEFGFGLMHTAAMVNLARHWRRVQDMHSCLEHTTNIDQTKPGTFTIEARACQGTANEVRYAENVIAIISVGGSRRGGLKFGLTSPQGTYSELLPYRRKDFHTTGFDNWRFLTVRSWGENPHGQWKFTVDAQANVKVTSIQLEIHGTYDAPAFTRLPEMSDCHTQCHDGCVGLSSKDCHSCQEMTVFLDDNAFDCVPYDSCPPGFYKQEITCRKCAVKNC